MNIFYSITLYLWRPFESPGNHTGLCRKALSDAYCGSVQCFLFINNTVCCTTYRLALACHEVFVVAILRFEMFGHTRLI